MELSKIQGLPAHPLLVHIPVMGIPLCALLVVLYVARPHWRKGLRIPTGLLVAFTAVATVMAAGSGEKLQSMMSPANRNSSLVHQHVELGDQTKAIVLVFGAITLAYLALDWYRVRNADRNDLPISANRMATALTALAILAIVLGGVSTVWDVRTGHAGAKATWHDAVTETATTNGDTADNNAGADASGVVTNARSR